MQIRLISPPDGTRWDAYIQQHPQALLAHQYTWYEFIPAVLHIKPVYWLAEESGQIVGIAPFFLRSHLGLGKRLTSMPYLNTGGIRADSPLVRDALWQTITAWASENHINSIELRSRYDSIPDFSIRTGRTASIIRLDGGEAAAWDNMRSTARNRIRKAEKAGLVVQHGFEHLEGFWRAYAENMLLLGAPVLTKRWFMALAETPALNAHLITVRQDHEIVGGMVLMNFKNGTENGWTASTVAARALYCNDLLYWEAVRWAVAQGLQWLDLGRSQTGGGHERFKEKFGAETIALPYQEIHRTNTGWQAVQSEPVRLYNTFTRVWSRLPLPLATRLGTYISRQIY